MVRISVLGDALKTMYNAEKRGKRQVLIRPASKVVIKFLQLMQKHGYIGDFELVGLSLLLPACCCLKAREPPCPCRNMFYFFLLLFSSVSGPGRLQVDDHRAGKIVVELNGRLNKCGVMSPRYDVSFHEIEDWIARLLPSRQFGVIVLTTSAGEQLVGPLEHAKAVWGPEGVCLCHVHGGWRAPTVVQVQDCQERGGQHLNKVTADWLAGLHG